MAKKSTIHKCAKKVAKKNPTAIFIAIVAILLILAITFCVLYFCFPSTWDTIVDKITDTDDNINDEDLLLRGDGDLVVHYIDVGQGDCILIQLPDGKEMLIDCANYNNGNAYRDETLGYLDDYITDNQIDYLMLTHCDSDHVYYLDDVINKYDVDNIYMPNVLADPKNSDKAATVDALDSEKLSKFTDNDTITSSAYADFFISALSEDGANIILNIGTFSIKTDMYSFNFYCYSANDWTNTDLNSAEEKNAISPIGILEYNDKKLVFTGDSNEVNEPYFMKTLGGVMYDCDVLKVGHHGSKTSSTIGFLDYINCEYAIISCNAKGNNFNHPSQDTLDRLKEHKMQVYRTDLNGNIVLTVNGKGELSFVTEKTVDSNDIFIGADIN